MVTLRKEIKMGAAIGITVIGIVGVYGLMASLSGGEKVAKTDSTADSVLQSSEQKLPNGGQSGLPPLDEPAATPPKTSPAPTATPAPKPAVDPFAESNRKDGIANNDAIIAALNTGKLVADLKPKTDDAPVQTDSPLVRVVNKQPAAARKSPLVSTSDDVSTNDQPAKAAKPAAVKAEPAPAANGEKYTVQSGDTFSTIAAKVYGSKKFYTVLVKANPDINPSRLKIGNVINVPSKQSAGAVHGAVATDAGTLTAPIDTSRQYRVQPGDTLSRIAGKLYGKSAMWEAIYAANKAAIGGEPGRLKIGSVLSLPQKPTH